uniref:ankyrin repeat domain-containing protein n=1 Tax=Limimaricola soesokkakensis TaxID=1343159 RepID=UPI0035166499
MALHKTPLVLALALLAFPVHAEEGAGADPTTALRLEEAQTAVRLRNYSEAAEMLAALAAAGNAEANYMLATLYRNGRGVPQDEAVAFDLTRTAAEAGHVEAQFSLGTLYLSGRGTDEDAAEARRWIAAASEAGHRRAKAALSELDARDAEPASNAAVSPPAEDVPQITDLAPSRIATELGWTLLMEVARRGEEKTARKLLEQGAAPDETDKQGRTALMHAAETGHLDTARSLVEAGADPDLQDAEGRTALALATGAGHFEIVEYLVMKGARSDLADKAGNRPLQLAIADGQTRIAMLLAGEDLSVQNPEHQSRLLMAAARSSGPELLRLLSDHGLPFDLLDEDGRGALWHAAASGNAPATAFLIENGPRLDQADHAGEA